MTRRKALLRRMARTVIAPFTDLRTSTHPAYLGPPGALIRDIYGKISDVPGWFNVDDAAHFHLILEMQSAMNLRGDLFEIGSYHGRSTALMARSLRDGERLVICDAFELDIDDGYTNVHPPSPELVIANVQRANPGLDPARIEIHPCLSNDLKLDPAQRFRFVHIDGGHSAEQVHFDLSLVEPHVLDGAVIAVDDYGHADWPGVTEGVDRHLRERPRFTVLADLNRHGDQGRKLYLKYQSA